MSPRAWPWRSWQVCSTSYYSGASPQALPCVPNKVRAPCFLHSHHFTKRPCKGPRNCAPWTQLRAGPLSRTEGQYRALGSRPGEAWQPLGILFQEQAGHPGSPLKSPEKAHASHAWWSRGKKYLLGSALPGTLDQARRVGKMPVHHSAVSLLQPQEASSWGHQSYSPERVIASACSDKPYVGGVLCSYRWAVYIFLIKKPNRGNWGTHLLLSHFHPLSSLPISAGYKCMHAGVVLVMLMTDGNQC